MTDEQINEIYNNIDPESISKKMASLMMLIVTKTAQLKGNVDYIHVMKNFTKEEMAYVVCVHAVSSVKQAVKETPELIGMLGAINALSDLESKIKED